MKTMLLKVRSKSRNNHLKAQCKVHPEMKTLYIQVRSKSRSNQLKVQLRIRRCLHYLMHFLMECLCTHSISFYLCTLMSSRPFQCTILKIMPFHCILHRFDLQGTSVFLNLDEGQGTTINACSVPLFFCVLQNSLLRHYCYSEMWKELMFCVSIDFAKHQLYQQFVIRQTGYKVLEFPDTVQFLFGHAFLLENWLKL